MSIALADLLESSLAKDPSSRPSVSRFVRRVATQNRSCCRVAGDAVRRLGRRTTGVATARGDQCTGAAALRVLQPSAQSGHQAKRGGRAPEARGGAGSGATAGSSASGAAGASGSRSGSGWQGQHTFGDPSLSVGQEAAADRNPRTVSPLCHRRFLVDREPAERGGSRGGAADGRDGKGSAGGLGLGLCRAAYRVPSKGPKESRPRGRGAWSCHRPHNERCWSLNQLLPAGHHRRLLRLSRPRCLRRPWCPKAPTTSDAARQSLTGLGARGTRGIVTGGGGRRGTRRVCRRGAGAPGPALGICLPVEMPV